MYFRQCKLQKGDTYQVSYIPDCYAEIGRLIKLKEGDIWESGWEVIEVSNNKTDCPPDYRKDIRGHRKTTGDSLPKNIT